ncbi:MAG: PorV/PorQ family protein [candidate division KSB1 bacterium]|nr:PorV/PorQ family protein [candidate division KSB1 bacterium]MDQ7064622.1 PorV/PorQ family protein [candidate division KSB1 bacterium]
MSTKLGKYVGIGGVALLLAMAAPARGQQADGGFEGIFSYGVGARALGLGGAYIAAALDASVVYWNPGGLDLLTRKSMTLFYSSLPLDGQFNFVSYVHPTVSTGTFGVAVLRVGTDGIPERDELGDFLGQSNFAQIQLLLSYGKQLPYNISIGTTLKIEQQDFQFSHSQVSGRGIGADVGLIYRPEWLPEFLQNLSLGFIIQNAIPPIMKIAEAQVRVPRNYKFGIAKLFRLSSKNDALSFYGDVEKGEQKDLKMHFGVEYAYQGGAMLRLGFTERQLVFGAGIAINRLQIDYSYGSYDFSPEFPQNHRVSISLTFGKSKQEIIELAKREREEAIAREAAQRAEFQRKLEIKTNIEAGLSFFQKQKYFDALIKFNAALNLDPDNEEAAMWARRAEEKLKEEEERERERLRRLAAEKAQEQQRVKFVENQLQKGISYFNAGKYNEALTEWRIGLDRDPDNPSLKKWIARTKEQIQRKIRELRRQSELLAARGRYLEAIDKLSELKRFGVKDEKLLAKVNSDIAQFRRRMNYEEAYRRGVTEYFNKNYKAAMQFFEQALRLDPNNPNVKEYYKKAEARANAREEPFKTPEIERKYKKAVLFYAQRKYEAALKLLQEIEKEQPYSKQILKLIDDAEEALRNK